MKTFLEDLRKELKKQNLNDVEIADIINDHEEMISQAMEEGLSEDQIIEKFGDPKQVAEELGKNASEDDFDKEKESVDSMIESFSKEGIHTVDFKLIHEDINISVSPSDQFELHGENIILKYYKIYEKAGTLYIERKHTMDIKLRIMRDRGESFTLKIPNGHQLKLMDIKSKASDFKIDQLKADKLDIKSVSGDLSMNNSQIQNLQLKSVSGDAHIGDSAFTTINISNVSGDYKFKNTKIDEVLIIGSVSGDFFAEDSEAKDVEYRAVSGDFEGREFYPKTLTLKSVSGDITIKNKDKSRPIEIKSKKTLSGDINI
ncbi:MAG: DUF4097 family beta strand repeat-containing protein [Candidatus Izemoplasmatales bacterium]